VSDELPVIHQDADLVVVDKPAGIAVIPARAGPAEDSLRHRLQAQLGVELWVVHRIDRDASGLVVMARTAAAHRELSMAFEHRQVDKSYVAFTAGVPAPARGTIDVALHPARKGKSRPARPGEPDARAARTDYEVERSWRRGTAAVARVEARPQTGRLHQIRVHLRFKETPIVGDPLYGAGTLTGALAEAPCRRLALHAHRLALPGRPRFEAPLAADLEALQGWLDAGWEAAA
jgi:tRNA pseudouridine32 synthase/23S rRNA pseudouridine746 synthase